MESLQNDLIFVAISLLSRLGDFNDDDGSFDVVVFEPLI